MVSLPLSHALFQVLPFVALVFARSHGDLAFDQGFLEINSQRNQGFARGFHFGFELCQFPSFQEKLSWALGRMVVLSAMFVFRDMGIEKKKLLFHELGKRFGYLGIAAANGLYFRAGEDDSRFIFLSQKVFVPCL